MTDPASIAAPYTVEEVGNTRIFAVNRGSGHMVCQATDKANALMIAAALNTADARDADYLGLFAHVFELKKQCAALMHERDIALSALDAALDVTNARKAVLDAADATTQHKVQSPEWNAAYIILRRATVTLAEIEGQAS